MNTNKQSYTAPELTVVTMAAERGFAVSITVLTRDIELIIDYNPIVDYTEANHGTQNFGRPLSSLDPEYGPSNNFWNF